MYKIIELNELNIKQFNGKIIQVIESVRRSVKTGLSYGCGVPLTEYVWVLTCLVEFKEKKQMNKKG